MHPFVHSIRTAAAEHVRAKLTQQQLRTLLTNRCVLLLHMGKVVGLYFRLLVAGASLTLLQGSSLHAASLTASLLLSWHHEQLDECRAVADELRGAFPEDEEPWLIEAAMLKRHRKPVEEQCAVLMVCP